MVDTAITDNIDRILRGEVVAVAVPNPIPAHYGTDDPAIVLAQWLVMRERMLLLKPQDRRFYDGAIVYWTRRANGEDMGPVPNTGAAVAGTVAWDEGDCVGCQ